MLDRTLVITSKGFVLAAAIVLAALVTPPVAAAQTRGSLQVTATVVPTQAGFAGLEAAGHAAKQWAANRQALTNNVSTVAQVQVAYQAAPGQAAGRPAALVVEVDYLKN